MIESRLDAVLQIDHAVGEASLVQQLKPQADIVGQGWGATSHNDGRGTDGTRQPGRASVPGQRALDRR